MKAESEKSELQNDLMRRLAKLSDGRDEMNLCELPFATLSDRSDGRTIMRFDVSDRDRVLGRNVEQSLTVKGDAEYGLPTAKDEDIYLGLLKYTSDFNGFSDPEIRFCRADLFELMDWPKSNWAYNRLTKGMYRLQGVRLSYINLWRDNRNKQFRNRGAFGIIDSFEFQDSRKTGLAGSFVELSSVFRWSNTLFDSFDSGYIKKIDYGLSRSLSPAARRLYRYLDKHFYPPKKTCITMDLSRLAYQHIGVGPKVELDKVRKRYVGPAVEELQAANYLAGNVDNTFSKVRAGVWNATFVLASKSPLPTTVDRETKEMILALGRRGISTTDACLIVSGNNPATIQASIRAMDEQMQTGIQIRKPNQWFKASLARGFRASTAVERSATRPELRIFRSERRNTR